MQNSSNKDALAPLLLTYTPNDHNHTAIFQNVCQALFRIPLRVLFHSTNGLKLPPFKVKDRSQANLHCSEINI